MKNSTILEFFNIIQYLKSKRKKEKEKGKP